MHFFPSYVEPEKSVSLCVFVFEWSRGGLESESNALLPRRAIWSLCNRCICYWVPQALFTQNNSKINQKSYFVSRLLNCTYIVAPLKCLYNNLHLYIIVIMAWLKGYSTPKWEFCNLSLTHMSFQIRKSFIRLRNTIIKRLLRIIKDILDTNREACDCPIDCQVIYTVKIQKSMKNIARVVHLPSVVRS